MCGFKVHRVQQREENCKALPFPCDLERKYRRIHSLHRGYLALAPGQQKSKLTPQQVIGITKAKGKMTKV